MNYTVKFRNVTKKYKMYNKPSDKLKDLFRSSEEGEFHYALRNVSFEVPKGEIVGIIGLNGSGKSTLSNLIAGVTMPNKGKIDVKGSAALIAISSGLDGQLTGIENIELKGLMMGLTKEKIQKIIPQIIEFADIGKFIHQPVKTYSSGMKSRLGFAISVNINPDVLVIDEALSVGDQTFTNKCLKKMNEFKERGKTIFFISHSLNQVNSFCTKAIWLYYGQVREYGDVREVVANYRDFLKEYNGLSPEERKKLRQEEAPQFQHGLLQQTEPKWQPVHRKQKKKLKKGLLIGCGAAVVLAGGIASGLYFKDQLLDKKANEATENTAQSKTVKKEKPVAKEKKEELYIVSSNGIGVRKEANASSEKLGVVNFGDVYTVVDRKQDAGAEFEWLQVMLSSGETGWISSQYVTPFTPSTNVLEDTVINDITALLAHVYGPGVKAAPTYIGKPFSELKETYPNPLTEQQAQLGKKVVQDGNVQFGILGDKVTEVVFQNISLSVAKLNELLGTPSVSNEAENNFFYETKNYYISARSEQTHKEIQSIAIVGK